MPSGGEGYDALRKGGMQPWKGQICLEGEILRGEGEWSFTKA